MSWNFQFICNLKHNPFLYRNLQRTAVWANEANCTQKHLNLHFSQVFVFWLFQNHPHYLPAHWKGVTQQLMPPAS